MFGRVLRVHRRGFIWTTMLMCLMMAVAGLLNPLFLLIGPLLAQKEIALPVIPDTSALMMRFGLAYEFVGALYAAALGMRALRRDAKPGAIMWNLPLSRVQIVLRHYAAGASYVAGLAVLVGCVSFGALCVSGLADASAFWSLMHPVLGFMAAYSLLFGVAAVVQNVAILGAAAVLVPVALILPVCAMLLKPFSALALPVQVGFFMPYGLGAALPLKTLVGAVLTIVLPLLLALGVTSRRSL